MAINITFMFLNVLSLQSHHSSVAHHRYRQLYPFPNLWLELFFSSGALEIPERRSEKCID